MTTSDSVTVKWTGNITSKTSHERAGDATKLSHCWYFKVDLVKKQFATMSSLFNEVIRQPSWKQKSKPVKKPLGY